MNGLFLSIEFMNKNYDSEWLMSLIFGSIPILLFGYLFIFIGNKLKRKEKDKYRLATKARVISKRIVEEEDVEGYLRGIKYVFTLEYLVNGIRQVSDYESIFDYDCDYDLDVVVENGSIKSILNEISKETIDYDIGLNFKLHNILYGIGKFILIFGVVFIITEIFGDSFGLLFYIYIFYLLFKLMMFLKKKANEYKSNLYEPCLVEIINIKKEIKRDFEKKNNGSYYERKYYNYYPVIQYENDGIIRKKVVYKNINPKILRVGSTMKVLINRRDNKVVSEQSNTIIKYIFIIMVMIIVSVCFWMLLYVINLFL